MSQVVVVTGAAGGIGSVTCDVLEEYGWDVVAMDRRPVERDRARSGSISPTRRRSRARWRRCRRSTRSSTTPRVQLYKPLLDTTVEEWDAVAAVNIRAAFACIKASIASSVETQGRSST